MEPKNLYSSFNPSENEALYPSTDDLDLLNIQLQQMSLKSPSSTYDPKFVSRPSSTNQVQDYVVFLQDKVLVSNPKISEWLEMGNKLALLFSSDYPQLTDDFRIWLNEVAKQGDTLSLNFLIRVLFSKTLKFKYHTQHSGLQILMKFLEQIKDHPNFEWVSGEDDELGFTIEEYESRVTEQHLKSKEWRRIARFFFCDKNVGLIYLINQLKQILTIHVSQNTWQFLNVGIEFCKKLFVSKPPPVNPYTTLGNVKLESEFDAKRVQEFINRMEQLISFVELNNDYLTNDGRETLRQFKIWLSYWDTFREKGIDSKSLHDLVNPKKFRDLDYKILWEWDDLLYQLLLQLDATRISINNQIESSAPSIIDFMLDMLRQSPYEALKSEYAMEAKKIVQYHQLIKDAICDEFYGLKAIYKLVNTATIQLNTPNVDLLLSSVDFVCEEIEKQIQVIQQESAFEETNISLK